MPVTKRWAARSQLETAIALWFSHGDVVSIHTLAVAANDCYHAIGEHEGKQSAFWTWVASQPEGFKKRLFEAQNFFKHGLNNLKGTVRYDPVHAEILLFDSILIHNAIYGGPTSLMSAFVVLFTRRNPIARFLDPVPFSESIPVDVLRDLEQTVERLELFKKIAPFLSPKKLDKR